MLTLEVAARDAKESTDSLRRRGAVPAVFYGPKEAATPITIDMKAFERIFREAGETTIVTLTGSLGDKETLIHDVQIHPVTGKPLHADFYVLEKGKKITINVPLEFTGVAPAERQGHIIVRTMHEVEIEVAPAELPQHLTVDISALENVGDHISAKDIKLPPSATLLTNADEIIVSITEAKEEAPQHAAPAAAEGAAPAAAEAGAAAEGAAESKE